MEKDNLYFKDSIEAIIERHTSEVAEFTDMIEQIESGLGEVEFQDYGQDYFVERIGSFIETYNESEWVSLFGPVPAATKENTALSLSKGGYDSFSYNNTTFNTQVLKMTYQEESRKMTNYFLGIIPEGSTPVTIEDFPLILHTEDGKIKSIAGKLYEKSSNSNYSGEYVYGEDIVNDVLTGKSEDLDLHRMALGEFLEASEQLTTPDTAS